MVIYSGILRIGQELVCSLHSWMLLVTGAYVRARLYVEQEIRVAETSGFGWSQAASTLWRLYRCVISSLGL